MNNGKVRYVASGDVPGHLLNQFSMDEFEDHLRVATTVEGWTGSRTYLFNNVYVLDDAMQTVGRIEYIAPDERIYSSRFIGDRLYLVTFKRVDPFFVIDLSDPAKPGILGMLKIPGFSDYLHPYDKNHIIGIGRETAENQWGGVSTLGLKLALFDVSDVNNPAMIDKVEIGVAGTDSEALRDHKAFLFDRSKNLLVIPVEEVREVSLYEGKTAPYTMQYWNGAYVFGVTPETGFVLRGKVAHGTGQEYVLWCRQGHPVALHGRCALDNLVIRGDPQRSRQPRDPAWEYLASLSGISMELSRNGIIPEPPCFLPENRTFFPFFVWTYKGNLFQAHHGLFPTWTSGTRVERIMKFTRLHFSPYTGL